MEIAKQMAGFSPAEADDLRKAVGKKKRDLMATMKDKFLEGLAASGTEPRVAKDLWSLMEAGGRLLLQPLPRRLLRADRLPDRLAAGQLSGRVHGRPDLLGDVHQGQGPVLRQPLRRDGHRGAAARRQRLRPRLRRHRQEHPLRARRGQERRPRRRCRRSSTRAPDGEFTSLWDFCERVDARAVNKRAVECLIKCGALDSTGAPRRGCSRRCRWRRRRRVRRRQEDARAGQGSIFDLGGGGARGTTPGRPAPADRRRSSTSASCCASRRRRSGPSSPRTRWPRSATRSGARVDCSLSELADQQDGACRHGRRDRHRVQAAQDQARRA